MRKRTTLPVVVVALALLGAAVAQSRPSDVEAISFSRDVLPLLSDRCFPCHGPDAGARKAGLRLDRESDAVEGADGVIVRHRSAASELYRRIRSTDPADWFLTPSWHRTPVPPEG